jgi:tetratricopeptide (TPR) repeat protein
MMISVTRRMVLVTIGLVCLAGLYVLHVRLDQLRANTPKFQRFMYLPQGEVLKVASLGFQSVVADFLWLQAVQAMGERKVSDEAGRWIYRALDVVTTLDPKFVRAYEAGGLALCTLVVLPEESNALLEKGMKHNPQVWQLPFYVGINYYFEFGDDAKAGEYIARAARLPGAPEHLAFFSARLYASSREPQAAIDVLAQLYEQAKDESLRRALERRLKEVIVERDLQLLEEAISRYSERHKRMPDRLDELVGPGFLLELPRDPFGGTYLYNPETQAVRSSSVDERIQVRGKRRGK